VVVTEGTGPSVEPGRRILFNETVLTRSYAVASSTHFSGEPRRALLDGEELPPWLVEGITGMRAGERRRLFVLPLSAARSRDPEHSPADDPLYHDIELLAIEPRG
jgi:FKBP-type peptidyl-prolyl cis-trans isomerase